MTSEGSERLGRVGDAEEDQEPSSTTDGPAADGEYDPSQGSPGAEHPTGEGFPEEATRFDEPDHRPRSTETGGNDTDTGNAAS